MPQAGRVVATDDAWEPYRRLVQPTGSWSRSRPICGICRRRVGRRRRPVRTGMDLLRWFRFLWAVEVAWDRATRVEARDFCRWLQIAGKPTRPHWRRRDECRRWLLARWRERGPYAASVRAHSETVLRSFYDFHRDAGTGPILNPFPLDRSRRGRGRTRTTTRWTRTATSGPGCIGRGCPSPVPAQRPGRGVQRDLRPAAVAPGPGVGGVLRLHRRAGQRAAVGTRAGRRSGAAADHGGAQGQPGDRSSCRRHRTRSSGCGSTRWRWTSRSRAGGAARCGGRCGAVRPLTYHAVHRMFERANDRRRDVRDAALAAAHRRLPDGRGPGSLPLTDVQFVLGHAQLTTTQIYLTQPSGIASDGRVSAVAC